MKSLIAWFVKNPVAANLMMLAMIAAGIFGYMTMDREFFPQGNEAGVSITASWPGASPQDVEEQLVVRMEEAVDGLEGIDYIEGRADEGLATVSVYTKARIDYEKMLDQVKSRVDSINNLPPDSFRPEIRRMESRMEIMYLALHGNVDRLTLQRAATDLRYKLTELTGLQLTTQSSKVAEQVTIEIAEDELRKYNLTFNQVAAAISGASVNQSAGTVETTGGNLQLRARSLANSEDEFGNIIVRQTSDGAIIRVRDIANVIDGFDDVKFTTTFKGEPAAVFQVLSPDNPDITGAGEAVRQFDEEMKSVLPPGLSFSIWYDGSNMFDSRMSLIGSNAISGMALVLIILMLFLRPKVALWVTVGIGAAFMGAIAIAPALGITLNMISLFAFLLVIGIVVDDAIVVGESVHFHVENGIAGQRGAIAGPNMVVKPVYFAVITTMLMFVPFLLLSGEMAPMTAQISLVVIAVLLFSLIEAFFILPAHLRHLNPIGDVSNSGRLIRMQNAIANSLVTFSKNTFRPFVARLIKYRYYTVAVFVGLFIFSVGLLRAGVAPTAFMPEVQGDMIQVSARFPEGTKFERLEDVRQQFDAGIKELNQNAKDDFGIDFELVSAPGTSANTRTVEGFLGLSSHPDRRNIATKDISDKLEEYIGPVPDAFHVNYGYTAGPNTGGGGIRYGITSIDPEALENAVLAIKAELESYSAVQVAFDSLESSASEIRFELKPGAEALGITLADLTRQVRSAFFGQEVQRLPRNGEDVRVMVRYPESARESIDSLKNLRIRTATGVEVPIYSVAEVTFGEGAGSIRRRDRKRQETVGARIRGEQSEVDKIKADLEANFLPQWRLNHPTVGLVPLGDDEAQATFMREIVVSSIVVLFIMYGLLAIAFKSYAQPMLIMIAIPFALVGMIFGNIITGVPFGMMSMFGFFAASGVAINDNLVLIDYVNRLRSRGVGAYQAMLDACVARFRPILLTSVTTFVGIMPILFETSPQAEFLKPMVVALAFGVLFDFFLTLMLVPAMYGIGVDITRVFRSLWTGVRQPGLGSSYNPEIALALEDLEMADDKPLSKTHTGAGPAAAPAE